MNKTNAKKENSINIKERILVSTENLMILLDCGRSTAVQIGDSAYARVQWGKRVLWNLEKIRDFVNKEAA